MYFVKWEGKKFQGVKIVFCVRNVLFELNKDRIGVYEWINTHVCSLKGGV